MQVAVAGFKASWSEPRNQINSILPWGCLTNHSLSEEICQVYQSLILLLLDYSAILDSGELSLLAFKLKELLKIILLSEHEKVENLNCVTLFIWLEA